MKLEEYTRIIFKDRYITVHKDTKGYDSGILIQGKIEEIDLSEFKDKDVVHVSGQADNHGIHFWIR